jgi:hypothetical protein
VKIIRQTRISFETKRVLAIKSSRHIHQAWCSECSATTQMFTPEEAATVSAVETHKIYQWIAEARVHSFSSVGTPLICLNSILSRLSHEVYGSV